MKIKSEEMFNNEKIMETNQIGTNGNGRYRGNKPTNRTNSNDGNGSSTIRFIEQRNDI